MKSHVLFSGENKKNISKCRLLKILSRVLSKALMFAIFWNNRHYETRESLKANKYSKMKPMISLFPSSKIKSLIVHRFNHMYQMIL